MKKIFKLTSLEILYFAIGFGCMFLGFLSPLCWVFQPAAAAFITAVPVILFSKNWKKFGGLLILPGIYALIMILMGEISGAASICAVIVVLLAAELIRYLLGYENKHSLRIGHAAVSLPSPSTLWEALKVQ